ncbi:uncharacterized protein LOC106974083 [Acinonyx jubatus]|uniref:Uncharacterized protein LOC106974083 n=1 Tax=Acinonyx jubatus TaxID=32536 RepID=A0A6J1Y2N8_ACIJB|nr:uncharacterized protein LOC106974083 [Acinonyx jubatus]XP_026898648.2 uncharacterized protein LOC106974083 [Acinonyx jubatus]XP_026898650.2 uncharacterized protein LOC106974083 [Acinonyx jubatus]XP_026898653.2 uncharacterized protein LOC106974083 [Acinonyx jubatus]XP_026898655.2 uncharacterized protein LOC106974083 [Acinonyx jubatus]
MRSLYVLGSHRQVYISSPDFSRESPLPPLQVAGRWRSPAQQVQEGAFAASPNPTPHAVLAYPNGSNLNLAQTFEVSLKALFLPHCTPTGLLLRSLQDGHRPHLHCRPLGPPPGVTVDAFSQVALHLAWPHAISSWLVFNSYQYQSLQMTIGFASKSFNAPKTNAPVALPPATKPVVARGDRPTYPSFAIWCHRGTLSVFIVRCRISSSLSIPTKSQTLLSANGNMRQ